MFSLTPFRSSILDNFFNDSFIPVFSSNSGDIKVDIKENEKEYLIEAELPGVKKDEISVELENNLLTISVEHNEEINIENERYIRKERRFGSMKRSFAVENINEDQIEAKFENGILSLALPKKSKAAKKPGKIEIQ